MWHTTGNWKARRLVRLTAAVAVAAGGLATTGGAFAGVAGPGSAAGLEIIEGPNQYSASTEATIVWSHDDPDSEFECKTDDGTFEPCTSPASIEDLGEGPHRFTVRAVDAEGETTAQEQLEWIVDLTAPSAPTVLVTAASMNSIVARWAPSSDNVRLAGYVMYLDNKASSGTIAAETFTFTNVTCGPHIVGLDAVDSAGNVSARTQVSILSFCPAPRPRCVVPSLVGKRLARARTLLIEANCAVGKLTRRYSFRPRGRVLRQSDLAGRVLPQGSRINLVVSRGPQP